MKTISMLLVLAMSSIAINGFAQEKKHCGSKNSFMTPERVEKVNSTWSKDFNKACEKHDKCYENRESKSKCDKNFNKDMGNVCKEKTNAIDKAKCEIGRAAYSKAVEIGGDKAYKEASKK